jgi:hypothetical protein
VVPLALGGLHTKENVQAAHHYCNQAKGCDFDWTAIAF